MQFWTCTIPLSKEKKTLEILPWQTTECVFVFLSVNGQTGQRSWATSSSHEFFGFIPSHADFHQNEAESQMKIYARQNIVNPSIGFLIQGSHTLRPRTFPVRKRNFQSKILKPCIIARSYFDWNVIFHRLVRLEIIFFKWPCISNTLCGSPLKFTYLDASRSAVLSSSRRREHVNRTQFMHEFTSNQQIQTENRWSRWSLFLNQR